MGPLKAAGLILAAAAMQAALPAAACEAPDEGGNTPWRRAVSKVKYRPDTEAMAGTMARERSLVQYVVALDQPRHLTGRCWWPVEVRVDGRLWKRFLVTPDGHAVREDRAR